MKHEILQQLLKENPTVRVVFATVALGMGVNIPHIHQVVHLMVPRTIVIFTVPIAYTFVVFINLLQNLGMILKMGFQCQKN